MSPEAGNAVVTTTPRTYRCIIPLVFRDAQRFFEMEEHSVTDSRVDFFVPAGGTSVETTWTLRARRDPVQSIDGVLFDLLVRAKADIKVEVEYRFCIQSPAGTTLLQNDWYEAVLELQKDQWHDMNDGECFEELEFSDIDEGHTFDGNLHVYAEVLFQPLSGVPEQADLPPPMMDMNSVIAAFHNTKYSDFMLISADGEEIKTHKLVLGSVSPVFQAMFDTDCRETRSGQCKIEDADAEGIRAMLGCILGADIAAMVSCLIAKVFQLADKYEMMPLKEKCEDELAKKISMENVVDILVLADKHPVTMLKTAGFTFMETNIRMVTVRNIGLKLRRASNSLYKEWLKHLNLTDQETDEETEETSQKRPVDDSFSESANKKKSTD